MKTSILGMTCLSLLLGLVVLGFPISILGQDSIDSDIEVLVQGHDSKPMAPEIEALTFNMSLQLWHYSGGYWKYNDLVITDEELSEFQDDYEGLADFISKEFEFAIDLEPEMYRKFNSGEKMRVYVSTTLPGKQGVDLFELANQKPLIKLKNGQLLFEANPKFNFVSGIDYLELVDPNINVPIPIVHPDFGTNVYAIWKRDQATSWGMAYGYFNLEDHFAHAPEGTGRIAPTQIKDETGHLIDGFIFRTHGEGNRKERLSNEASVGYGTFDNGGAVGLSFDFPLVFTFYPERTDDLSAHFSDLYSSANRGSQVIIGIQVSSTFPSDQTDVPYQLEITDSVGNRIDAVVTGHANDLTGELGTIPANGEQLLYTSFVMPDRDVHLRFVVNESGDSPVETYLDNNVIEHTITMIEPRPPVTGNFDLGYDILSRTVAFPLSDSAIRAQLSLPRGRWNGNAQGSLNVSNQSATYYRNFNVRNNPPVNEASTSITRDPSIQTTIRRADFGDNPQAGNWLNPVNPYEPVTGIGEVSYRGDVSRRYTWTEVTNCPGPGEEGECTSHTRYGTASAEFQSGSNIQTLETYVYNGMPTIMPKYFENRIDQNSSTSLTKHLLWESEPYQIDVIRWMYHLDEHGVRYGDTAIAGQYQRVFTQQNSGTVAWSTTRTMAQEYKQAREAARGQDYKKDNYDKAVFASDIDFRDVDYPIKSGYYFNPSGEYTFTVETVTYKPTPNDTADHQDLVDAVIHAFRYESDLMYINSNQEAVNLQNEPLNRSGSSYARRSASLTASDPTGVDGFELLNVLDRNDNPSRYEKRVEELPHSTSISGNTHPYWKAIMEGYAESGTLSSRDNFQYIEYVDDGERMYRITEKTTVTIQVNPTNRYLYTHAHMPDGQYTVRAWFDNIHLSNLSDREYKKLNVLYGVTPLDDIEVSVDGSIYDDIR